jgi:hypothetical protein
LLPSGVSLGINVPKIDARERSYRITQNLGVEVGVLIFAANKKHLTLDIVSGEPRCFEEEIKKDFDKKKVETNRISKREDPTLCTSVIVPGSGYHMSSLVISSYLDVASGSNGP